MSEFSFNDNISHHTDKESQVPLVPSRARSNDEISYNSQSPVNVTSGNIQLTTNTSVYASGNSGQINPQSYNTDRKQVKSFYSPLAFKDDTMFNSGTLGHTNSASNSQLEPQTISNNETRKEKFLFTVLCHFCGQFHEKNTPHLYDYSAPTDKTLLCIICHQTLVDPIETNCRHTFCRPCLETHLTKFSTCPHDNFVININECKEAPVIVKNLLDKLRVVCPNVDYCEEELYRFELYDHLKFKCRGAIIPCINAGLGCPYQGSRNSFANHHWECQYKNLENGRDPLAYNQSIQNQQLKQLQMQQQYQHHQQNLQQHQQQQNYAAYNNYQQQHQPHLMYGGDGIFTAPNAMGVNCGGNGGGGVLMEEEDDGLIDAMHQININQQFVPMPQQPFGYFDKALECNPIIPGTPTEINILRENQCDLGFSFVGGIDSPLGCIIIQEVYLDGLISHDGRLRPGDEIRMVNGHDLSTETHALAKRYLSALDPPICRLLVFREKSPSDYETFSVNLQKNTSSHVGLVLDKKKHGEGIYIRDILPNSEAYYNGKLVRGDRILSINDADMTSGSQNDALKAMKDAGSVVYLKVQRRISVPDVVKTTDDRISLGSWSTSSTGGGGPKGTGSGLWKGVAPHSDLIGRRNTTAGVGSPFTSVHQVTSSSSPNSRRSHPHTNPSSLVHNPTHHQAPLSQQQHAGFTNAAAAWSASEPAQSTHSDSFKSSPEHQHHNPHQHHQHSGNMMGSGGHQQFPHPASQIQSPHHSSSQQSSSHHSSHPNQPQSNILPNMSGPNIPPPLTIPPPPHMQPKSQYGVAPVEHLTTFFAKAGIDRQMTSGSDNYQSICSPLPQNQCREDSVEVTKAPSESLSITVAGGLESQRGNVPIYVTTIIPNGVLSQYKKVKKGSVLLAINNQSLIGRRHREAVEILKQECHGHSKVTLHYIEGAETSSGAGNFMPSWKFWLQLPPFCAYPQIIELYKEHPNSGLGFSIVGGTDNVDQIQQATPRTLMNTGGMGDPLESMGFWSTSIMVKSILPNSVAFNNGKLKSGDILLEVNNYPLFNIRHSEAVMILKRTQSKVTLKIISWPGTMV